MFIHMYNHQLSII